MGLKKTNALLNMSLMASLIDSNESYPKTEIEQNESKEKKTIKKIIPKGLKEFFYDENVVYALNKKNADRKALKKGYL
jgi:hypothetical protein